MQSNMYIAPLQGIYSEALSALAYTMLNIVIKESVQPVSKNMNIHIKI